MAFGQSIRDVKSLVDARLYNSEEEVIRDALRYLFRARPEARIRVALQRYQSEDLSLAKAAEIAGVSWPQMASILQEHGLTPRLGPTSPEQAKEDVETLKAYFDR